MNQYQGPGLFLTFEGIDGSGKSSQCRLLADLRGLGREVVLTREPAASGKPRKSAARAGDPDRWSAETEILLFTAARRDHLERTILPALVAGKVVICDRFADPRACIRVCPAAICVPPSTVCTGRYPARAGCYDIDRYGSRNGPCAGQGAAGTEERFEDFGLALQEKMRAGFHRWRMNLRTGSALSMSTGHERGW